MQLYLVYFGLATVLDLNDFVSGVIAVSVNTTAYIAEIIRSKGFNRWIKGKMGRSFNGDAETNGWRLKIYLATSDEKYFTSHREMNFTTLIKKPSIVSLIGIHDLMYSSDTVRGATLTVFIPLLMTAFLYFVMTTTIASLYGQTREEVQASD